MSASSLSAIGIIIVSIIAASFVVVRNVIVSVGVVSVVRLLLLFFHVQTHIKDIFSILNKLRKKL